MPRSLTILGLIANGFYLRRRHRRRIIAPFFIDPNKGEQCGEIFVREISGQAAGHRQRPIGSFDFDGSFQSILRDADNAIRAGSQHPLRPGQWRKLSGNSHPVGLVTCDTTDIAKYFLSFCKRQVPCAFGL